MRFSANKASRVETWKIDEWEDYEGGTKRIRENVAEIIFTDGLFTKANFYGVKNPYSRKDWEMMAFINYWIGKIERVKKSKENGPPDETAK